MSLGPRLLFDVTFTRTQDVNVGITRTVRRLQNELGKLAPRHGFAFIPVAFNTRGFRVVPDAQSAVAERPASPAGLGEKLRRWITNGPIRRLVSFRFPLPLRWLAWRAFSWWEFNRLSRGMSVVDAAPGDILFTCDASWSYRVWLASRLVRKQGGKVVTVVYDLIPLRQPQYCTPLTVMALRRWVHRQLPQSDAILCISSSVEQDLRRYAIETRLKLPPTASFRLGSDPMSRTDESAAVRPAIRDVVTGAPCFTAIGSFEPRKNYGLLLNTFDRLWERGVHVHLMIIGRRNEQCPDLLARINRHFELGKRLLAVFDGSDAEVAYAYAESRALLFPSLAEGFGLPLVEARVRGCTVIASDIPAFVELADSGVYLYPAASSAALESLIVQHSGAIPLDKPPPMSEFTWRQSARQCLEFVDNLAHSHQH